ncbi:MAG TPA: 4-(cytidine 5'-diphospho)-2-C-methyl-D-erythritol kinase, partial [Xanthobacteraceae bacterium]
MPRARAAPLTGPATAELAFAKVNLTLRVLGRRRDGHHDLESLVCFAAVADRVKFRPGPSLELAARGPTASDAGPSADNAVMKAARALAERVAGLTLGRFDLVKRLPAGAGFGGGSADAGAALRLLARANRLDPRDPRLFEAARATGADVPVCLDPQPRWIGGTGDVLS